MTMTSSSFQRPRCRVLSSALTCCTFGSTFESRKNKKEQRHRRQRVPLEGITLMLFDAQRRRRPVAHEQFARCRRAGLFDQERLKFELARRGELGHLEVLHNGARRER